MFLGRVFGGPWAGSVQAALWPVVFLLVAALGLAVPRYGQPSDDVVVGYADRVRIILAVLLKGVGGGFTLHGGDRTDLGSELTADIVGTTTISLTPLTVTALWIAALYLGLRVLRTRMAFAGTAAGGPGAGSGAGATAGLEAAVRVSLSVAVGVLLVALFAQPSVAGIVVSSSPVLAALGALLLALVVSTAVLCRGEGARWLAGRPGAYTLLHATSTALRALAVVLVLGAIAAFIALSRIDDLDEQFDLAGSDVSPLVVALLVVPNLAVAALGLGWGAPLKATAGGSAAAGGSYESESFGLSRLADTAGSGAVVGALALGLVCALTVGVCAARRSPGRRGGQLLAAGIFFVLFLLLAAVGGLGVQAQGIATAYDSGGNGSIHAGLSVPDALLFGLLWLGAAVFVAPYLLSAAGRGTPGGGTPAGGLPSASPAAGAVPPPAAGNAWHPAAGAPHHPVVPAPAPPSDGASGTPPTAPPSPGGPARRSRAVVWVAVIAAAFLVGGGTAAGILLWQNHHGHPGQDQPTPTASSTHAAQRPDRLPLTD